MAYACLFQVFEWGPNLRHCTNISASPYSVLDGKQKFLWPFLQHGFPQARDPVWGLPFHSFSWGNNLTGLQTCLTQSEKCVAQESICHLTSLFSHSNRGAIMGLWIPGISINSALHLTALKSFESFSSGLRGDLDYKTIVAMHPGLFLLFN